MDVTLLIYDLSRGLARQMSMGILGFQLYAIYHTSILLNGREYVYDGGIISIAPGSSHLGQPMERLHLGKTELTMDIVEEYLDSVRSIFTLEAYDLFQHNCNNFTDSFSNFLLGKGIPSHIASMPQAVLESPMGRMLLPQLTQGVNAGRQNGSILGLQQSGRPANGDQPTASHKKLVREVSTLEEFSSIVTHLESKKSNAVIFFTSATCPPCKPLYPVYENLAEEFKESVVFIKIDISLPSAHQIAQFSDVRATPTFVTMVKGKQDQKWSGANAGTLRNNVRLLSQMKATSHTHDLLRLHSFFSNQSFVLYKKAPPLEKLLAKAGSDFVSKPEVQSLKAYLETREAKGASETVLPNLSSLSGLIQSSLKELSLETLFPVIDLFRFALVDSRVSGYFAEEQDSKTVCDILELINNESTCPYALRLVALQMACNMFSTPLFTKELLRKDKESTLLEPMTQLISSSFLDESHNNVRVAASSLLFNVALAGRQADKTEAASSIPESSQLELAAALMEAIEKEVTSVETLQGMLSALGHLFYGADLDGELADLLRALEAKETIIGKKKTPPFANEKLIAEVGSELLGKGLNKP